MLLRGAVRYPLSRRQSTMGFGAVVGLLVGAGSQPSPCSPQWGWGGCRGRGLVGAGCCHADIGHAGCPQSGVSANSTPQF